MNSRTGSPKPRALGSLSPAKRVDPAIGREQRQPVGGLGVEVDERPVAFAPLELADLIEREMALHRPDPAALRQDDGDRLLVDHRRPVDLARDARFLDPRPALVAELVP